MRKISSLISVLVVALSLTTFTESVAAKKKPRAKRRARATQKTKARSVVILPLIIRLPEIANSTPVTVTELPAAAEDAAKQTNTPAPQAVAGIPLVIAEFRTRGPNGKFDEFVKLYNNSNSDYTVQATDSSAGYGLVALSGAVNTLSLTHRFTVPNGTVIPAHGFYLGALANTGLPQQNGYSLSAYAAPDVVYGTDIDDDRGIALFDSADPANWTLAHRIDAVGFNASAAAAAQLAREGTPLASAGNTNGQYSWVRKIDFATIQSIDTHNNAADFVFISHNAGTYGGAISVLGYPGPQNLNDPPNRPPIAGTLIPDASSPTGFKQNVRNISDTGTNKMFGTLTIFRRVLNQGSQTITKLRFRVVEMTTANSPNVCSGCPQADIRFLSSGVVPPTEPKAITLEAEADQPAGGGLNTSANVGGAIDLGVNPLLPGQFVDVRFVLGVQTPGYFRFFLSVEAK